MKRKIVPVWVACVAYAMLCLVLCAGPASAQKHEEKSDKALPIPSDLAVSLNRSVHLGREMFWQDKVSAIGTDALRAKLGDLRGKGISGYLTFREAHANGTPTSSWIVFFFTKTAKGFAVAYRIHVPMKDAPQVEVVDPPEQPNQQILTLFRARQRAIDAARPFTQSINPVILPADFIGQKGILVELIAGTGNPGILVLGKHYRVIVSEDGDHAESVMPLTKEVMELPKSGNTDGLVVSQIVTDYPTEAHVFASMLYHIPIFVATKRGIWKVDQDSISLVSEK